AEDGIRDIGVTGVQTCALPISEPSKRGSISPPKPSRASQCGGSVSKRFFSTTPAEYCHSLSGLGVCAQAAPLQHNASRQHAARTRPLPVLRVRPNRMFRSPRLFQPLPKATAFSPRAGTLYDCFS